MDSGAVDFSAISTSVASHIYYRLNIMLEDGLQLAPLEAPPGGYPDCGAFNMAGYPDKEAAVAALLALIAKGLELQPGVAWGRGGFQLLDLHRQDELYQLHIGDKLCKGGLDGGVTPFRVSKLLPAQALRCGIHIAHPNEHKEQHAGQRSGGEQQRMQFTGTVTGQALMQVLAACVFAEYPSFMLLVTSFDDNILLEASAGIVTHWEGISFNAGIYKMGQFLSTCDPERNYRFVPSTLPWQESERIMRLRERLRPTSALLEQLDSITLDMDRKEKFATALEFFRACKPRMPALEHR